MKEKSIEKPIIIPISRLMSSLDKVQINCSHHPDKISTLHCRECQSELCFDCFRDHKKSFPQHKFESYEDQAAKSLDDVENLIREVNEKFNIAKENRDNNDKTLKYAIGQYRSLIKSIENRLSNIGLEYHNKYIMNVDHDFKYLEERKRSLTKILEITKNLAVEGKYNLICGLLKSQDSLLRGKPLSETMTLPFGTLYKKLMNFSCEILSNFIQLHENLENYSISKIGLLIAKGNNGKNREISSQKLKTSTPDMLISLENARNEMENAQNLLEKFLNSLISHKEYLKLWHKKSNKKEIIPSEYKNQVENIDTLNSAKIEVKVCIELSKLCEKMKNKIETFDIEIKTFDSLAESYEILASYDAKNPLEVIIQTKNYIESKKAYYEGKLNFQDPLRIIEFNQVYNGKFNLRVMERWWRNLNFHTFYEKFVKHFSEFEGNSLLRAELFSSLAEDYKLYISRMCNKILEFSVMIREYIRNPLNLSKLEKSMLLRAWNQEKHTINKELMSIIEIIAEEEAEKKIKENAKKKN